MRITTDQPIIADRKKITQQIARYWNQLSYGWQRVWGTHIHHGYYEHNQTYTPETAQEKLLEKLLQLVEIKPQDRILDVGCGMGGSSLYMAKHYAACVTGITLSQKQVEIATCKAKENHITNVLFKIEDALHLSSFADHSFDMIWSLESCEQFYDKRLFIQQAYSLLKPGGKLMLATWCSSHHAYEGDLAKKYRKLCLAFDLPYMPTRAWYSHVLATEGFHVTQSFDWSSYVKPSWEIGMSLLRAYHFIQLLKLGGWRGFRFAQQVKLMRDAFAQERVQYGVWIAVKQP